jgi:hypothetical protein
MGEDDKGRGWFNTAEEIAEHEMRRAESVTA